MQIEEKNNINEEISNNLNEPKQEEQTNENNNNECFSLLNIIKKQKVDYMSDQFNQIINHQLNRFHDEILREVNMGYYKTIEAYKEKSKTMITDYSKTIQNASLTLTNWIMSYIFELKFNIKNNDVSVLRDVKRYIKKNSALHKGIQQIIEQNADKFDSGDSEKEEQAKKEEEQKKLIKFEDFKKMLEEKKKKKEQINYQEFSKEQLVTEAEQQAQRIKELDSKIQKKDGILQEMTQGYIKDVYSIKEQMFRKNKDIKDFLDVKFFNENQIMDELQRQLLNQKIEDIKQQFEQKLKEFHIKLQNQNSIQMQLEKVIQELIQSQNLQVDQLLSKIFVVETDKYKIWREIEKLKGNSYFFEVFDNQKSGYEINYREIDKLIVQNRAALRDFLEAKLVLEKNYVIFVEKIVKYSIDFDKVKQEKDKQISDLEQQLQKQIYLNNNLQNQIKLFKEREFQVIQNKNELNPQKEKEKYYSLTKEEEQNLKKCFKKIKNFQLYEIDITKERLQQILLEICQRNQNLCSQVQKCQNYIENTKQENAQLLNKQHDMQYQLNCYKKNAYQHDLEINLYKNIFNFIYQKTNLRPSFSTIILQEISVMKQGEVKSFLTQLEQVLNKNSSCLDIIEHNIYYKATFQQLQGGYFNDVETLTTVHDLNIDIFKQNNTGEINNDQKLLFFDEQDFSQLQKRQNSNDKFLKFQTESYLKNDKSVQTENIIISNINEKNTDTIDISNTIFNNNVLQQFEFIPDILQKTFIIQKQNQPPQKQIYNRLYEESKGKVKKNQAFQQEINIQNQHKLQKTLELDPDIMKALEQNGSQNKGQYQAQELDQLIQIEAKRERFKAQAINPHIKHRTLSSVNKNNNKMIFDIYDQSNKKKQQQQQTQQNYETLSNNNTLYDTQLSSNQKYPPIKSYQTTFQQYNHQKHEQSTTNNEFFYGKQEQYIYNQRSLTPNTQQESKQMDLIHNKSFSSNTPNQLQIPEKNILNQTMIIQKESDNQVKQRSNCEEPAYQVNKQLKKTLDSVDKKFAKKYYPEFLKRQKLLQTQLPPNNKKQYENQNQLIQYNVTIN